MLIEIDNDYFADALSIRDIFNSDNMDDLEQFQRVIDILRWKYEQGYRHGIASENNIVKNTS